MRTRLTYLCSLALVLLLWGCGGQPFEKTPVAELMDGLGKADAYTILLRDMDLEGEQYRHDYTIIEESGGAISSRSTGWMDISDPVFKLHENDIGMEVAAKLREGGTNRLATPPGFTNYVGNIDYGSWGTNATGQEVWFFKSQYAALQKDLGLDSVPILKSDYEEYHTSYRLNKPYYGPVNEGKTHYGGRSHYIIWAHPGYVRRRDASRNFFKPHTRTVSGGGFRGGGGYGK